MRHSRQRGSPCLQYAGRVKNSRRLKTPRVEIKRVSGDQTILPTSGSPNRTIAGSPIGPATLRNVTRYITRKATNTDTGPIRSHHAENCATDKKPFRANCEAMISNPSNNHKRRMVHLEGRFKERRCTLEKQETSIPSCKKHKRKRKAQAIQKLKTLKKSAISSSPNPTLAGRSAYHAHISVRSRGVCSSPAKISRLPRVDATREYNPRPANLCG